MALDREFNNTTMVPTGDWAWVGNIDRLVSSSIHADNTTDIPEDHPRRRSVHTSPYISAVLSLTPSSTFVSFDVDGLQERYHCGPRCSVVSGIAREADDTHFFTCEVAVSEVQNSTLQEHQMGDRAALLAAGSIALDGTVRLGGEGVIKYQYTRYNNRYLYLCPHHPPNDFKLIIHRTEWGAELTDTNQLAKRVGKFAAGTIAMLDSYRGTTSQVPGRRVKDTVAGVLLSSKTPELVSFHLGIPMEKKCD